MLGLERTDFEGDWIIPSYVQTVGEVADVLNYLRIQGYGDREINISVSNELTFAGEDQDDD